MDPEEQRSYWDRRTTAWDASTYGKRGEVPWSERVASLFRRRVMLRITYALEVIREVAPKNMIELGCGTGELLANLPLRTTVQKYVGVDISAVAIEKAASRQVRDGLHVAPEFIICPVQGLEPHRYEDFDFVAGLGLLPYVTDQEFGILADLIRGKSFLFDYHPRGLSVVNALHWCYRRIAKHPFYRMHSEEEVADALVEHGVESFEIVHPHRLSFVQNKGS